MWGGLHQIRTCTIVDTGTPPSLCMPQKKIPVEETTSNIDCTETEITNAPTDNSYTCEVICPDPSSDCFWWNSNGECEYKAVCPNGEQMDCRGICVVGSPTYNFDDCDICDDDATNDCQL